MMPIKGAADNGRVVYVDVANYSGPAGYRDREGWAEIAFFGDLETVPEPATATVDGRAARVLRILPSGNPGVMTTLAVAFV